MQVIVPALLAPLQSFDRNVRLAAMQCVRALADLGNSEKPKAIYGFDMVYGPASGK
jgi:U3 small nucleolar RNA-associated protein 10